MATNNDGSMPSEMPSEMDLDEMDLDDFLGGGLGNAAAQSPPTSVPSQMDRAPNASKRSQSDEFDDDDIIAIMDGNDAQVVANRSISELPAPLHSSTRRGPNNKVARPETPQVGRDQVVLRGGCGLAGSSLCVRGCGRCGIE